MDNFDRRTVIASAAIVGAVATATASSAAKRAPKPVPPAPEPVPPAPPKPVPRPVNLVFFAINPNSTLTLTTIPFADYNPNALVGFASTFIDKVHANNIPTSGYYILDATTGESL